MRELEGEYTEHLLDLSDNQYYFEENPINQLQYSSPDPDYYSTLSRRSQTQPCDPNGYYPPPLDRADIQGWHACGKGKHALLYEHRLFSVKRPNQLKAGKPERDDKTIKANEKVKFLTFFLLFQNMINKLDLDFNEVYWTHFIQRYRDQSS